MPNDTSDLFPPIFSPQAVDSDDPRRAAIALASQADASASLLYRYGAHRSAAALVLSPEQSLGEALQILFVASLALEEALGSVMPPQIGVTFAWPDRILVNGGEVGHLTLSGPVCALDAVPDWLVLAFDLAMTQSPQGGDESDPASARAFTCLLDEGAGFLDPHLILLAFSRYFLSWLDRWQRDGLSPVLSQWKSRAAGLEEEQTFVLPSGSFAGRIVEVEIDGTVIFKTKTGEIRSSLADLVTLPAWGDHN